MCISHEASGSKRRGFLKAEFLYSAVIIMDGRESCYYSNFCESYGYASGEKGSARVTLLQKCMKK